MINSFVTVIQERHTLITPDEAMDSIDYNKDLLIMVIMVFLQYQVSKNLWIDAIVFL